VPKKKKLVDYVQKEISKRCFTCKFTSWKCPQNFLVRSVLGMSPNDESFIMLLKMVVAMEVSHKRFYCKGEEVHVKRRRLFNSQSFA
jgi:hypothetical protein